MKNLKIVVYPLVYVFGIVQVFGQNKNGGNKTESAQILEEIIVKENRIEIPFADQNRNIQIIGNDQIKSFSGKSINEVLSYAAGIDIRQRGPQGIQADIGIDGGTFDQTLVLINGIKISDPQTGHNMMNLPLPLSAIDHIEILHGAAARIYGVNTLTGAINIVTVSPRQTDYSLNVHSGTSFKEDDIDGKAYISAGIDAHLNLVEGNTAHLIAAGYGKGSGYRYNTAFNQYKAFYQGKFGIGKTDQLDVTAGYAHNNFGANAFYAAPGDKESEETVKTGIAAIGYKTKLKPNWSIFPRFSVRFNQDDYLYIKQTPEKFHNTHNTRVYNGELNNTIETSIGTIGLGFEGRFETIKSSNLGDHTRSNLGVFGEYKKNISSRLLVVAGAYTNYNTDYGWQVFPGIDAGYKVVKNWKVYVNAGTGQRLPTYTDLYYKSPSIVGNAQLQPEIAQYIESGIKFNNEHTTFNASYFHRHIERFIDYVKDQVTDPWVPQNLGKMNVDGFTVSGNYRLSPQQSLVRITSVGLSYTYLDPQITNTSIQNKISRYTAESLGHQLLSTANLQLDKVSMTAGIKYCKRIRNKDYTLIDTRLSYSDRIYKVYAEVSNLLDVTYIEAGAVPMPGSWYTLGIELFKLR